MRIKTLINILLKTSLNRYFERNGEIPRGLLISDKENHKFIVPRQYAPVNGESLNLVDVKDNTLITVRKERIAEYRVLKKLPQDLADLALVRIYARTE